MSDPYEHLPLHPGSRATGKTAQVVPKVLVGNRGDSEFLSLTVTAALAYWHVSFQLPTWSSCHSNSPFCKRTWLVHSAPQSLALT